MIIINNMNLERAILVAFIGNYLINNVVAALVALIPASQSAGVVTPQYIAYVTLAAIFVGVLTWWYAKGVGGDKMRAGVTFGVVGFLVSLVTAFITGVAGVLAQTGSLAQVVSVIPNFGPFLASWATLVLLGYWLVPAVLVGWWTNRSRSAMQ